MRVIVPCEARLASHQVGVDAVARAASSCVPVSTSSPRFMTQIPSASRTVDRRWATDQHSDRRRLDERVEGVLDAAL